MRMGNALVALVLAAVVPIAGCAPLATAAMVTGGAGIVGADVVRNQKCTGESCLYASTLAFALAVVGIGLVSGGGTYFVVRQTE